MTRINSRAKGQRFERDTAKFFRRWFPDAQRQTQDQARDGAETPDVKGTPFWIECKHYKKIIKSQIIEWISKAESDNQHSKRNYRSSLMVYKKNYSPVQFAMPLN